MESKKLHLFAIGLLFSCLSIAQNTVGLTKYESGNSDGYVLFSPMVSKSTYLINKCGEKVHEWTSSAYKPALSAYLLEDGSLLRTGQLSNASFNEGGGGGIIERFDWSGNRIWNYSISNAKNCLHHDVHYLPNGNILGIVWDSYTKQEAFAEGKDTSYTNDYLWSEKIVELKPIGTDSAVVVWEWILWDHLVQDFNPVKANYGSVSANPGLIDINYFPGASGSSDWIHLNSIDYNVDLDQILVSSHTFNEIWIIDHSTSTAEAASHTGGKSNKGGDILYRWGNPQAYDRGTPANKIFYGQHHATWIPSGYPNAGKILVFNNGLNRTGTYSSVDMIAPPIDLLNSYSIGASTAFLPQSLFWTYAAPIPSDFYSSNISGVYAMENGSFIVTSGTKGLFFEIDSTKQTVWSYTNPANSAGFIAQGSVATNNLVFRSNFYKPNYPGLSGQNLTSMGEIELNPTIPSICSTIINTSSQIVTAESLVVYPNPFSELINIDFSTTNNFDIVILDSKGKTVLNACNKQKIDTYILPAGMYFLSISNSYGILQNFKMIKK